MVSVARPAFYPPMRPWNGLWRRQGVFICAFSGMMLGLSARGGWTIAQTIIPQATRTITGQTAGDQFGMSVSPAGDVNGDGDGDVLIGARFHDARGSNTGRASVYFGGPAMDDSADVILTGEAAGDQFGNAVSGAGDVNADGFNDVIVGAYLSDAGGDNAGRAYLYFGGSPMDTIPDVILTGRTASTLFGSAVGSIGDFNGDGFDDVIVGASHDDLPETNTGRAYLYFGGPAMDDSADVILAGDRADSFFGSAVGGNGDVNGDGLLDLVIGAHQQGTPGGSGRAYLYYGGPARTDSASVTLAGETPRDLFGWSVSIAGDANGDGINDLMVGAPRNSAGGSDAGLVYLFLGADSLAASTRITFTGRAGESFGVAVGYAGDINRDGFNDLLISARTSSLDQSLAGRVYIFFGGSPIDTIPDLVLRGEHAFDSFGSAVASDDLNADQQPDVIVGAPLNDAGGTDAGRVYVYERLESPTAIENPEPREMRDETSRRFALHQSVPNPFNRRTVIRYTIPVLAHTTLTVYDVLGRTIKTLVDQTQTAGTYLIEWNGTDYRGRTVSSGLYFYQLRSGPFSATQRAVLLK